MTTSFSGDVEWKRSVSSSAKRSVIARCSVPSWNRAATGQRAEAIAKYQAALKLPGSLEVRHDQYHMKINKQWVEDRLRTPFTQ